MAFLQKEKIFSRRWLKAYAFILTGTFIMAVSFVFFISPYRFAPGGVYGISIVLHHKTVGLFSFMPNGLPIGMMSLCMDIVLTIIGIKILGPKFGAKTIVGFTSTAIFVDLLENYWGDKQLLAGDPLLSAIFGGVILGVGLGLVFRSRATSGGSDIIAMIAAKYSSLPLGQLMIWVDSIIVLFSLLAFQDWKIPFYSWIIIFITGKVVDVVLQGANYDKTIFIISDKHEEIRNKIINDLDRGGTLFYGKGMFNDTDKTMIFTVVNRREMEILKDYMRVIDPRAFVTVMDASEILGEGFKSLNEHVD